LKSKNSRSKKPEPAEPQINHMTQGYPPQTHLLRDLGIYIDQQGEQTRAGMEIVSHMCTSRGGARAGVVGTLVDVVAGAFAARAVAPNWIATLDMVLHQFASVSSGVLIADARALRRGRSTVVVEVEVHRDGQNRAEGGDLVALATVTFSVLEARGESQRAAEDDGTFTRTLFALSDSGLTSAVTDRLGARVCDASAGEVELEISSYNTNTLGALQGGGLAILVDLAAEVAGRSIGEADWITEEFVIHYLALGKQGPLRTSARVLQASEHGAQLRIEVRDEGSRDRLVSVVTALVGPLG